MDHVNGECCDWAVNSLGNVLLAAPRFHEQGIEDALLDGGRIVFRHDRTRLTAVEIPDRILGFLASEPSILLVAFEADGNVTETDLPLRRQAGRDNR